MQPRGSWLIIATIVASIVFYLVPLPFDWRWFRPELPLILEASGFIEWSEWVVSARPKLASEWFFPLNASITLACGWIAALLSSRRA